MIAPPHALCLQLLLPLLLCLCCPGTKHRQQHLNHHADGNPKTHLFCRRKTTGRMVLEVFRGWV